MHREFVVISPQPEAPWVKVVKEAVGEFGEIRVLSASDAGPRIPGAVPEVIVAEGLSNQTLDLVRRLRRDHPGSRIVLAASTPGWKQIRKAHRAGASDVIDKNLERKQLVRTLVAPTVLLADNKKEFLAAREKALRKAGLNVVTASTYDEAKEKLASGELDLAILDIRLRRDQDPKDDSGLALAELAPEGLPKVFLTNFPSPESAKRALRWRRDHSPLAADFLDKREPLRVFTNRIWQVIREAPRRPRAEARAEEADRPAEEAPSLSETRFERLFEAKFERLLEGKLAKLQEKNIEGVVDKLVRGPVLDNYRGFICARFEEAADKTGPRKGADGRTSRAASGALVLWMQSRPPRDSDTVTADAVEIRNGRKAKAVTFELQLDSEELHFRRHRANLRVQPGKRSKRLVFPCQPGAEEGSHPVWVQVYQKNRLIQVLRTEVAPGEETAEPAARSPRIDRKTAQRASG